MEDIKFTDRKSLYKAYNYLSLPDYIYEKKFNVLLVNLPCMGFGDVVFCIKFAGILKEWFKNANIKIATTRPEDFKTLGESSENIYSFDTKKNQCRRLKNLNLVTPFKERFDLIFVAPLAADFNVDMSDVRSLIPYADRFNTFFISEYNDSTRKGIDFNTGIGKGRDGLLFTDIPKYSSPVNFKDYAVIYVAETITNVKKCIINFCSMVAKKHNDKEFNIVLPSWIYTNYNEEVLNSINKYFGKVIIHLKDGSVIEKVYRGIHTIHLRYDIFPLKYNDMRALIQNSVKDILVTGDQSLTDVLSCCIDKNIFYQIAPWKENLAKQLSILMPNKWLKLKKTSCGTIKAIRYNSDYENFKKNWDFRILARDRISKIFYMSFLRRRDKKDIRRFIDTVKNTRTIKSFKQNYYQGYLN